MAAAVAPGWRQTSPASLDEDLAGLWEEASASGPISRAVMSNLVIIRPQGSTGQAPDTLDEVLRRHPARAILIDYAADQRDACAPESIAVSLLVFGGTAERYGVERIAVKTSCADASLPSLVRRLIRGDVPTSVWWAADAARWPVALPLAEEARQLVYDSGDWTDVRRGVASIAAAIRQPGALDLADINWRRLSPLRQAVRHAVALEGGGRFDQGFRIRIEFGPGKVAAAWLIAGWLQHARKAPAITEQQLEVVPAQTSDPFVSVSLDAADGRLWATWSSTEVSAEIAGRPPVILPPPAESPGAAIASELDNLGREYALRDTLELLERMPTG